MYFHEKENVAFFGACNDEQQEQSLYFNFKGIWKQKAGENVDMN